MSLRIRRGTDAERLTITPLMAEPLWTTDSLTLYIGDGLTPGGIRVGGLIPVATVAEGELQTGIVKILLYVNDTETIYHYVAAGAAYTRDGLYVLNTLAGGNTRWVGIAGRYAIQPDQYLWGTQHFRGDNTEIVTGANLLTNGDFATGDFTGWVAGAGWSAATFAAVHTPGTTNTLVQNPGGIAIGNFVRATFILSAGTAGSLTLNISGVPIDPVISYHAGALSYIVQALNTNGISFTPSITFDGAIDNVSLQILTPVDAVVVIANDDDTTSAEIRAGSSFQESVHVGVGSGRFASGEYNVGIGSEALGNGSSSQHNVAIGRQAGRYLNSLTGSENVVIGYWAARNASTLGNSVVIGRSAGIDIASGFYNVIMGYEANYQGLRPSYNTYLGVRAGHSSQFGQYNVAIGANAGYGNHGDRNVFIGYQAGENETGSDTLYIDNTNTTRPLIWGDFSGNHTTIYGNFSARYESVLAYNNAFGVIPAYTVVKAISHSIGTENVPNYVPITSYNDIPIGMLTAAGANNALSREIIKQGVWRVTGFDTSLSSIGARVYSTNAGALTLTKTNLPVGIVVELNANGVVYFNFTGVQNTTLRIFADVATAEASTGNVDDDLCYVVSTSTFYKYESVTAGATDDNTFILSTAEGGNTRWMGIAGRYDLYKSCIVVSSVAEAELLVNQSLGDLLYVDDTETVYRYETNGVAYTDDNTFVLSTGAGGNTRWLAIAGQYKVDNLNISGNLVVAGSTSTESISVEVYNDSGGAIAQYKIVQASGVDGTRPEVEALDDLVNRPLGIATVAIPDTTAGYVLKQGVLQVTGFDTTGSAIGNKVFSNATGDLTLTTTAVEVGIVLTLNANGTVYFNIGGSGGGAAGAPTGDPLAIRLAVLDVDGAGGRNIDTDLSLYQVAALSSVLSGSVVVTNRNAVSINVRVAAVDGAIGAVVNADYIFYDTLLLPYETKTIEIPGMSASDSILVRSDTLNVNFQLHGLFTATIENLKRIAAYATVAADTNEQVVNLANNTANFKIYCVNRDASNPATIRVALIDGGLGALASEDYVLYNETLTAGETRAYKFGTGLASGGTIAFRSSTTSTNILVFGEEF